MIELANDHPAIDYNPQEGSIHLKGAWTVTGLPAIEAELTRFKGPQSGEIILNCSRITTLDSAGALLLYKFVREVSKAVRVSIQGMQPTQQSLYELVSKYGEGEEPQSEEAESHLVSVGRFVVGQSLMVFDFLSFVGRVALVALGVVKKADRFRWRSMAYHIESCGFDALPIIGLLSFLIGIVSAYQGGVQLRQFGANIYITDLVGLSITREFAPLITAILVAGRTGSSFAAQLATMKVTEEIDAIRVLGMDPMEVLVLPKLAALLIAMPLLILYADILGILGGLVMAGVMLDVSAVSFIERFPEAVSFTSFLTGIGKAPVFAAIITMVGCYQGLIATGSAENVGISTTTSVVQSIFLIIVADALFSVLFSWVGV